MVKTSFIYKTLFIEKDKKKLSDVIIYTIYININHNYVNFT
jgi:hypothetical protein